MNDISKSAIVAILLLTASAALAGLAPDDKCQAGKSKVAGAYYACRQKAEATSIAKGGLPDYSKCTAKFTSKWDKAETDGAGMCPDQIAVTADMDAFVSGQATQTAAVIAGAAIPACGDGIVNTAGEHCDGAALDGYTCASFGLRGTLACSAGCDFNLAGCTSCPAPGIEFGGACWVLGAGGASCNTACATLSMVYDDTTSIISGSDGSNANCTALLDTTGAPGGALDNAGGPCTFGLGCAVVTEFGFRARCGTPATDATSTGVGIQRICACK